MRGADKALCDIVCGKLRELGTEPALAALQEISKGAEAAEAERKAAEAKAAEQRRLNALPRKERAIEIRRKILEQRRRAKSRTDGQTTTDEEKAKEQSLRNRRRAVR